MISYGNLVLGPMVIGAVFGIGAGVILGLISGVVAVCVMSASLSVPEPQEAADHD
jgi:hypothetical protein